jgi:hypothetical protein
MNQMPSSLEYRKRRVVENGDMWEEEGKKGVFRASKYEGEWFQKFACWVRLRIRG